MRKVCIDTNIYSSFKKEQEEVVEAFRHFDFIGIDITVLAELYAGFALGRYSEKNRGELKEFINSSRVHLLNHDRETAEFYAHIFRRLRCKGTPIPSNDIWIAAVAMQYGLTLYSQDGHFSAIDGLLLYDKKI